MVRDGPAGAAVGCHRRLAVALAAGGPGGQPGEDLGGQRRTRAV